MSTKTRIEKEAKGNSEMAYFSYHNIQWTKFERKSIATFISEELPSIDTSWVDNTCLTLSEHLSPLRHKKLGKDAEWI